MDTWETLSGLSVVGAKPEGEDERAIQRELTRRHRGLFLDKEVDDRYGRIVYVVRIQTREGERPHDVLYWHDRLTLEPLPLSSALLDRLDSLEKGTRGTVDTVERVNRTNDAIRERNRRETDDAYDEILRDGARRMDPMHSAVLHRGQHLRRARDRQRSRGEQV